VLAVVVASVDYLLEYRLPTALEDAAKAMF
jgi:hypothetical protein